MSLFLCPHFSSMSEFIPSSTGQVSHGDCGWDALLMAANTYDPARFPLTGDGLAALRDDAIAHGYADANGAVNIPNLDRYLTDHGYPHRTVGYAQFDLAALHTLIQGYLTGALKSPIILETSTAGAGLPEDEAGVQFHFFALGGEDSAALDGDGATGGYLRGDGDAVKYNNWPGPKYPLATSWNEIVKAGIIGYIILDGVPPAASSTPPQGGSMTVPAGWTDNPAQDKLSAPNGHSCQKGIRQFVLSAPGGWQGGLPLEEEHAQIPMELGNPAITDGTQQTFERAIVEWIPTPVPGGPSAGCFVMWSGKEILAYRKALAAAQAALKQTQSDLATMQAQRDALSAKLASGQQAVVKIAADTQSLSADVAAATKALG